MDTVQHPSLAPLFGGLEIGMALGLFCSGILTLQTWNYFRTYPNDLLLIRISVAAVHVFDLLHSIVTIHAVYHYTVLSFGDYVAIQNFVWSLKATAALHAIIIYLVQLHFCRRIYYLEKGFIKPAIAVFLATTRFVFNVLIVATDIPATSLDVLRHSTFTWELLGLLISGLTSDVFIIFCICGALLRQRRSGVMSTKSLVDKLVAFTIGSGLLTTICTLCELVTYVTLRNRNFIFLLFYTILGKLFSNSFLASLNEREINRAQFSVPPTYPARIMVGTEVSTTVDTMELRPRLDRKSFGYTQSSLKAFEADRDTEAGAPDIPFDRRGEM